jgi:hypothetical protein
VSSIFKGAYETLMMDFLVGVSSEGEMYDYSIERMDLKLIMYCLISFTHALMNETLRTPAGQHGNPLHHVCASKSFTPMV